MKKALSVILVLAVVIAACLPAFAQPVRPLLPLRCNCGGMINYITAIQYEYSGQQPRHRHFKHEIIHGTCELCGRSEITRYSVLELCQDRDRNGYCDLCYHLIGTVPIL